jgi:hypothetical protein
MTASIDGQAKPTVSTRVGLPRYHSDAGWVYRRAGRGRLMPNSEPYCSRHRRVGRVVCRDHPFGHPHWLKAGHMPRSSGMWSPTRGSGAFTSVDVQEI